MFPTLLRESLSSIGREARRIAVQRLRHCPADPDVAITWDDTPIADILRWRRFGLGCQGGFRLSRLPVGRRRRWLRGCDPCLVCFGFGFASQCLFE